MTREIFVVGNWKMYKTAQQAVDYIELLTPKVAGSQAHVFLAVPFTSITSATAAAKQSKIVIGAQNMNDAHEGAFTGEIAAIMLKEAGAEFVLLGHSERRHLFGETNEMIHRKVVRALQDDLRPILCVGESLVEHQDGRTQEVLEHQLKAALSNIPKTQLNSLIVAYEPVWAIGTGKTATPAIAQEAHAFCRSCLEKLLTKAKAAKVPILYGGSVKPEHARELVSQNDINGVLVGGASLNPETLAAIVRQCEGL